MNYKSTIKQQTWKRPGLIGLAMLALIMASCMEVNEEGAFKKESEPDKDISGNWKVTEAYRNDVDIMGLMDFSDFTLTFSNDGSYTIENPLPFIVQDNGQWELDDPVYPFLIAFKPEGGSAKQTEFDYPISGGNRVLRLTFSPGCTNNKYLYVLVREENL